MTNRKSTKHALLFSLLALVVCFSMFIGSTYAWFTDTVTSTNNKIQSGTLLVDLKLLDKETGWHSVKESHVPIFNYDKWEPGYTDVKVLKIENYGTLSLKWVAKFVSEKQLSKLAEVIDVYVLPTETEPSYPSERTDLSGWTYAGTVETFVNTIEETTKGTLEAGEAQYLSIALKMRESAGNDYQQLVLGPFDIQIVATQLNFEEDSFDKEYDAGSIYPDIIGKDKENEAIVLRKNGVTVNIPAEAPAAFYELEVSSKKVTENIDTAVLSFDAKLFADGGKIETENVPYTVSVDVGNYLDILKVTHNGNEISEYTYANGVVTFVTNSFSPFTIEYVNASDDFDVNEDGKITSGTFTVNPVAFDSSLAEKGSEYIAVNYELNGKTVYEVIKRETTTVIVAPADYEAENDNYTVKNAAGSLYSVFSGLKDNEHSTVYLLAGTYTEATTINVNSSCDIIGLGDKEDIKVVKGASTGSNRHLFNCNGSKSDYIEVTISNMTLEVPCDNMKNNGSAEDNAAVQVIRKTKVKCYDLIINKAPATQTWENAAFYINANNAVDGVKYDAYLYVENTVVNATHANYKSKIYATNNPSNDPAKCYFNHYGLKYDSGAKDFTENSTRIKNISMSTDDWDWLN